MSDDQRRDAIVLYLIVGLLALVVIFLIYGLATGNGDDDSPEPPTPPPAAPAIPQATSVPPQVGCQQPSGDPVKGKRTIPPNPGVSARKTSTKRGVVSVTIPTSTQECRVARIRVQLDSTTDEVAATSKSVSVLTGPPVRRITVRMRSGSGEPQVAKAFAVTEDGRSSNGAAVAVR